jgi:hypothetical protein
LHAAPSRGLSLQKHRQKATEQYGLEEKALHIHHFFYKGNRPSPKIQGKSSFKSLAGLHVSVWKRHSTCLNSLLGPAKCNLRAILGFSGFSLENPKFFSFLGRCQSIQYEMPRTLKHCLLTAIFLLSLASTKAQGMSRIESHPERSPLRFECFGLPLLFYNSLDIGLSKRVSERTEHAFYLASSLRLFGTMPFRAAISYNYNIYIGKSKAYLPLWIRHANGIQYIDYEEGYYPNWMRTGIGTGIGIFLPFARQAHFRFEFGAGGSLNLTNRNDYKRWPILVDVWNYGFDKYYPRQNPKFIPAFRIKMDFVFDLGRKKG